jgi:hypothetical protein
VGERIEESRFSHVGKTGDADRETIPSSSPPLARSRDSTPGPGPPVSGCRPVNRPRPPP